MLISRFAFLILIAHLSAAPFADEIKLNQDEQGRIDKGKIVIRNIENKNLPGATLEAIGLINTPRSEVVNVILDFTSYGDFMPNVRLVDTLSSQAESAVLNYYLELPMNIEQKYRVEIWWAEQDSLTSLVEWNSIDWPGLEPLETIKATNGYWLIKEQSETVTLVLYHAYVDPGAVPFGFGWIVDFMTEQSFPEVFLKTRERIESLND